jgi:hypothetical protein
MPTNLLASTTLSLQLVLPAFNHFAERIGVDASLPFEESRVTKSSVNRKKTAMMAVIDNRHQFNWDSLLDDNLKGRIYYYDLQESLPHLKTHHMRQTEFAYRQQRGAIASRAGTEANRR